MGNKPLPNTAPKPYAFVIMDFGESFNNVYKLAIKPAATKTGITAERLDEQIYDEGMLERIQTQIARADFCIADVSVENPNVYYEVGYAHALNKVVLLITNDVEKIPFDLRHRLHIVYDKDNLSKLKTELAKHLRWALAEVSGRDSSLPDLNFKVYDAIASAENLLTREKVIKCTPTTQSGNHVHRILDLHLLHKHTRYSGAALRVFAVYVFLPVQCQWYYYGENQRQQASGNGMPTILSYAELGISMDGFENCRQAKLQKFPEEIHPGIVYQHLVHFARKSYLIESEIDIFPVVFRYILEAASIDVIFQVHAPIPTPHKLTPKISQ